MKLRSVMKRGIALALTLALMLTTVMQGGFSKASAADAGNVALDKLIAENYELSAAEEALLSSGLLNPLDNYSYVAPGDEDAEELVSVDPETKTITVKSYKDEYNNEWTVKSVKIVVGDDVKETATKNGDKYSYNYAGNAFSVKVEYALAVTATVAQQKTLVSNMAWLKNGMVNADALSALAGNLYIVEQAMPELVNLADNGYTVAGNPVALPTEYSVAIYALNKEMNDNDGKIELSALIAGYDAAASKTQYVVNNGAAMWNAAKNAQANIASLNELMSNLTNIDDMMAGVGGVDSDSMGLVELLAKVVANLTNDLAGVLEAAWWQTSGDGANIVANYVGVDALVKALPVEATSFSAKTSLNVTTATVQYNMSMFNVTYVLKVEAAGSLVNGGQASKVLTLAEGATKAEILAAVAEAGLSVSYPAEHYVMSATALPETLTADITYTVTWSPKQYQVNKWGTTSSVAYGTVITLPVKGGDMVYDYSVNGEYYAEGTSCTVVGDTTITRVEGKPYVKSSVYAYLAGTSWVSQAHADALTSGAVKGDEALNVRYPEGDLITLNGNKLTAQASFPSSYKGLSWVPTHYVYTINGSDVTESFNGSNEATLPADYEKVTVYYTLDLNAAIGAKVRAAATLSHTLMTEAEGQLSALSSLNGTYGDLGQLDKTKLGALNGVIDVTDGISEELKAEFKGIVSSIIATSLGSSNKLKIYDHLTAYNNDNGGGLYYYYKNSSSIIAEVSALSAYLNQMVATPEKVAALEILCAAADYPEYAELVGDIAVKMADIQAALTAPNAAIDLTDDGALVKLTKALEAGAPWAPEVDGVIILTSAGFTKVADKYADLTVSLYVDGQTINLPYSGTVLNDDTFTQAMANSIISAIKAEVAKADRDTTLYTCTSNVDAVIAKINSFVGGAAKNFSVDTVEVTWAPKTFTVMVEGMENQQLVAGGSYTINLAVSADTNVRYEYVIAGETVTAEIYTFTEEQVKTLFVNGSYTISRNEIDVRRERLENFVETMNASVGNGSVVFALNDDASAITMYVHASQPGALMTGLKGFAMGLVNAGYAKVGVNGEMVLGLNNENTLEISLQALVDAIMNSSFSDADLLKAINSDGSIGNGGKLISTELTLDDDTLGFTIALGSSHSALTKVRNAYAQYLDQYLDIVCKDGKLQLLVDLGTGKGDKIYQAYLAAMLVTDQVNLANVNELNSKIAVEFLRDLFAPAIDEGITVQSYLNTLEMLGVIDGADSREAFETIFNYLRKGYNKLVFAYPEEDTVGISANIPMAAVLDRLGMGDLVKMIKEYNTGLDLAVQLRLENFNSNYNALFFDRAADGIINKVGFTTLSGNRTFDAAAVVVLTGDVTGNLTFNGTTILNLNGYTLNGSVQCNGKVFIVDTSVAGNGVITGGAYGTYYKTDVKFYDMVEDENGNIVIEIDAAGLTHQWKTGDIATLGMDILADLAFNGYNVSKLYVNDKQVYDFSIDDLVDLVVTMRAEGVGSTAFETACGFVDSEDLSALINEIVADVTDFAALETAVRNDEALVSYTVETGNWNLVVDHIEDGDYVTVNVAATETETRELSLKVVGEDADVELLADLLAVAAETTTVEATVSGTQSNNSNTLFLDWSASGSVVVDLASNPEYSLLLAVLLSNGTDKLDEALAAYAAGNAEADELLAAAFNSVTTTEAIAACKALMYTDTLATLNEYNVEFKDLSADKIDAVLALAKQVAAVLRQTEYVGGQRTLGSFYKAELGGYGFHRTDIERNPSITVRGYSLDALLNLDEVLALVKIAWPEPEADECEHEWIWWSQDEENHWKYCSKCNVIDESTRDVHHFTEWAPTGVENQESCSCVECGHTDYRTVTPAPDDECEHNWIWWSLDEEQHWKYCTECGEVDESTRDVHHFTEWAPTENKNEESCYCVDCGHTDFRTVEPDVPKTGDNAPFLSVAFAALLSCGAFVALARMKRERK